MQRSSPSSAARIGQRPCWPMSGPIRGWTSPETLSWRPGEQHWPTGQAVLDAITARATDIARDRGHNEAAMTMGQIAGGPFAVSALPAAGWTIVRHFIRMARALSEADAVPVPLPAGVTVRTVSDEADRRSYHRVSTESFADHWGDEPETYDEFMRRVDAWESNDWSLWWLASAAGEDVGVLRARPCELGIGFINTLGVLKSSRGRGIGAALLKVGFAEFARRQCTRGELMVDSDNATPALRVYESAGMSWSWQADIWELQIHTA